MIRHVHLIDTSIASDNVGDEIIVQESRKHLEGLFPGAYISSSAGHDGLGASSRKLVADADIALLLGSNALAPHNQRKNRFVWQVNRRDIPLLAGKVVLFGVGANRDFDRIHPRQARLLKRLLSRDYVHSLRDGLGLKIVETLGLRGLNTSCPTLWRYADQGPKVPQGKSDTVIFTLTAHKADPADAAMLDILRAQYDRLLFWPQQPRDGDYLTKLGDHGIERLAPSLAAYDAALAAGPCDVVGTRLHGSIRGLSHGRRIIVVAIDNRAREIGAETGLPTVARSELAERLPALVAGAFETNISLPRDAVRSYLEQFGDPDVAAPENTRAALSATSQPKGV